MALEVNPLVGLIISTFGFLGLLVHKIVCILVILGGLRLLFSSQQANRIISLTCMVFGAFMAYMFFFAAYCACLS